MTVHLQKLHPDAIVPRYATDGAAGADLCALPVGEPIIIEPGMTVFIHTGIALAIPAGYVGLVHARSGMASKRGLAPANKVGVIDSDYRGELMVALHNHGTVAQTVLPGDRVAQLLIVPVMTPMFCPVESLANTARGNGGFGSTGSR